MTVLTAIQQACTVLGLNVPTLLYGSTEREHQELGDLANDIAERLSTAFEWQALNKIATVVGDGVTEAFSLPEDFDRMLVEGHIWTAALETSLTHIPSRDRWLELENQDFDFVINAWIMFGDQLHIKPALGNATTAQYFYQSNAYVKGADGTKKHAFDNDTDTFALDERLLRLGIIWQWRANKGLAYAEDMENYERLLARRASADKGSRVIKLGKRRLARDVTVAYPLSITPQ